MSKVTKKQKIILEKVNPEQSYSIAEALDIMQSVKSSKSVQNPQKSVQNLQNL